VATLYREGSDLDEILGELDAEYPEQVHVIDVVYRRDGGVLGFFAHRRVGVQYIVSTPGQFDAPPAPPVPAASPAPVIAVPAYSPIGNTVADAKPLDQLLAMAENAEAGHQARLAAEVVESGRPLDVDEAPQDEATNVEFARMLLDLATQKASERQQREEQKLPQLAEHSPAEIVAQFAQITASSSAATFTSEPVAVSAVRTQPELAPPAPPAQWAPPAPPAPAVPTPQPAQPARPDWPVDDSDEPTRPSLRRPVGSHRAAADNAASAASADDQVITSATPNVVDGTNPLVLRRQLVGLGVPVDWIPDASGDPYWVAGQLVNRLPEPPELTLEAGDILVIAGPAASALRAARHLAARLRMDPQAVRVAGSGVGDPSIGPRIEYVWQAQEFVGEVRRTRSSAIVVVPTDDVTEDASSIGWATRMVSALRPNRLWLVVDAAWRPADNVALITQIGAVEALVVIGAARTTSPASVWQLPKPIAMLDVQHATRGVWTALLIDKLTESV
jgi:hypothetical protein